jgi:Zn-dependent peptidase ImmA (M78 family)
MRQDVTSKAEGLLKRGNVTRAPVPVPELVKVTGATLRIGPLPPDLSGFLLREKTRVIIGVNSLHPRVRQRFTIAHEIGHLILHPKNNYVDRGFHVFFRDATSATAESQEEIQANQFAADLLMPELLLRAAISDQAIDIDDMRAIEALARRFDVSPQALTFRLINLGLAEASDRRRARRLSA